MNTSFEVILAEIEPELTQKAEVILNQQGLMVAEAIRLLFERIVVDEAFPLALESTDLNGLQTTRVQSDEVGANSQSSSLYQAFAQAGLIECLETDAQLATTYQKNLDFSNKHGGLS